MRKSYLSNDRVYLRAMEPEDLEVLYEMENDPSFWEVSSFTVPYSHYVLKQYIESSASDMYADKQLRLMIVRKSDDMVIGTVDVTDFIPLHSRGAVGIAIEEEYRKKGYAKDALSLLCDYVFEFLRLKQLYAHIPADNEASLALFTACGFQQWGLVKALVQTGGPYYDALMTQLVK